jgi:predicted negative regulator of RcsB-dependent stress response
MQNLTAAKTEDPVVYDHLGDTSLKLGKKQKAIEYWKKALSFKADPKIEEKVKNAVKN